MHTQSANLQDEVGENKEETRKGNEGAAGSDLKRGREPPKRVEVAASDTSLILTEQILQETHFIRQII